MSKEAAVKPAPAEAKKTAAAPPVADTKVPDSVAKPAAPAKPVATAAAVEKASTKPGTAKKALAAKPAPKAVAEKAAPAAKAAAKPARKAPAPTPEKPAAAPKAEKPAKVKKQTPKKVKLIRDSFSIPENEYALFSTLKQRALAAGVDVKKSEVLRTALATLAKLDDAALVTAIGLVERIKTGRPKK